MIDRLNMHKRHTILTRTSPPAPAPSAFVPTTPAPAPTPSTPDVLGTLLAYEEIVSGKFRETSRTPGEPGVDRAGEGVPTGAYAITEDDVWFVCPCGCRELSWVPVTIGKKIERSWLWNGSEEAPVLSPSISKNYGCRWHGFLGAPDGSKPGVWTTC